MIPDYAKLEDEPSKFLNVKVDIGGFDITWTDDLDLSIEELWKDSIVINM